MTGYRSPLRDLPQFQNVVEIPESAWIPYETSLQVTIRLIREWRAGRRARRAARRADRRARRVEPRRTG
jgi:hypothetical protein